MEEGLIENVKINFRNVEQELKIPENDNSTPANYVLSVEFMLESEQ